MSLSPLSRLPVRTGTKAGGLISVNHGLKVRSGTKAGGLISVNHGLKVRA